MAKNSAVRLNRRRLLRGVVALSAIASLPIGPSDASSDSGIEADLFLFAGQSNMTQFFSNHVNLPKYLAGGTDAQIKIYNHDRGVLETLTNSVNNNSSGDSLRWGPEAQFAYRFRQANPSRACYLAKLAIDGTWLADAQHPSWNAGHVGEYFDQNTGYNKAAKAAISATGLTPVVRALCWMQGESDATESAAANAYAANLSAFISKVRTAWGTADTKIIVGRITRANVPFANTVRTAQASVVAGDTKAALINTDSYPMAYNGIHYDPSALIRLGDDMYKAYASL